MPPKKSSRFIARTSANDVNTSRLHGAVEFNTRGSAKGSRSILGDMKGNEVKPVSTTGGTAEAAPTPGTGARKMKSKGGANNSYKNNAAKQSSGVANTIFGASTVCVWTGQSMKHLALYYALCFLTLGLFHILCVLYNGIYDWIVMREMAPEAATVCSIQVEGGKWESGSVQIHSFGAYGSKMAVVEIKCQRYMAYSSKGWKLFAVDDVPKDFPDMVLAAGGEATAEKYSAITDRSTIEILYGPNKMTLPEVDFLAILVRQILHPFYLFQYFAVIVWVSQDYVMYSLVILFITGSAIYMTATELVYNLKQLHNLAGSDRTIPTIDLTTGVITDSPDSLLVPGDCVIIQTGLVLPCDVLLTSGRVTVDESMLTGESVPVTKNAVEMNIIHECGTSPGGTIDFSKYPGNIMFGGTHVVQSSGGSSDIAEGVPVGIVFKTGFRSAKGQLVATLLNPKEEFMGFFSDAINVVIFMFFLATAMFIWTGANLRSQNAAWGLVFMKYLDAITIAVPPALTASLTVATTISIGRLRKKGIFVSETSRVNWAGICGAACFDKTGTLTEDRLVFERAYMPLRLAMVLDGDSRIQPATEEDVWGSVHGGIADKQERPVAPYDGNANNLANMCVSRGPLPEDMPRVCLELMATCHSLAVVGGTPMGDPLEVELLRASGWTLSNGIDNNDLVALSGPPSSVTRHYILRHFEFTADKMRAGTLMKRPTGELLYLLKGSPEVILQLSKKASIPTDVSGLLDKMAKEGMRVIAMAYADFGKHVDEQTLLHMSQDELESNIEFLGLLSMSNALKVDTKATIATLIDADIHSNMITGDHVQTAIAIAYNCGLLNHTRPLFLLDVDDYDALHVLNISDTAASNCACLSDPRAIPTTLSGVIALVKREVEEYSIRIPQLAISGKGMVTLKKQYPEYVADVVRSTQVFARMKPSDKQFIVEELMKNTEEEISRLDESVSSKFDGSCGQHQSLLSKRTELSSSLDFLSQHGSRKNRKYIGSMQRLSMMDESTNSSVADAIEQGIDVSTGDSSRGINSGNSIGESDGDGSILSYLGSLTGLFQDAVDDTIKSGRGNLHVVFCGDGANDMSALRAATVGVSLCEAETSVAAPITSRLQTPGAVIDVMKEGRCSLITAYVLITFNIYYAVIQLFMVCQMYNFGLRVGDMTYLVQDLFFTLVLGLAIAVTPPAQKLETELPPQKFFTPYFIFKLISQILCFPIFQMIALKVLAGQGFYDSYDSDGNPLVDTYAYETSAMADMGLAQLMIASVVSTVDHPFRTPWYTNLYHVALLVAQGAFVLFQIFSRRNDFLEHVLEIKPLPYEYCFILCLLIVANGVVSLILARIAETLRAKAVRSAQ